MVLLILVKMHPVLSNLPNAAIGQRYLLVADTPNIPQWNNVGAKANDIIEFNGTNWYVAFNSQTEQELNIVTNANTMLKYKWVGGEWIDVYQGIYKEGYWRLLFVKTISATGAIFYSIDTNRVLMQLRSTDSSFLFNMEPMGR